METEKDGRASVTGQVTQTRYNMLISDLLRCWLVDFDKHISTLYAKLS